MILSIPLKTRFLAIISLIAAVSFCQPALSETGWALRQRTQVGVYNVYIGKNSVRADELNTHYSILTKAPKWNVTAFRNDKKTYCRITMNKWMKEGLFEMNERSFVKPIGPKSKSAEKIISNLKYIEYVKPFKQTRRYSEGRIVDLTGFMSLDKDVTRIHAKNYKLLVAPKISLSPKIINFLSSLFVVPIGKGVPIKFTINFIEGQKQHPLLTNRVKQVKLNPKTFTVPQNLKPVSSIQLVTTGHSSNDLDSMIMDLGIGKDFGKSKPNKSSK